MKDLAGAHVLVTGGSRGIGAAIAAAFASAGSRVSLVARSKETIADAAAGYGGTAVAADLGDAAQVDGLIARVEAEAGPIDVLVNNAGIEVHRHLADHTAAEISASIATNLLAPMELARQAVPGMLERRRGHVVNVSSMAGAVGFPGMTTYASSKAGLTAFSRALTMDLKGLPVGVTSVEIGTVPTDMLDAIEDEGTYRPTHDSFQRVYDLHLMVRVPKEDVAAAVVEAVRKGKRKVWLPRRAMAFPLLSEAPQRIAELLLVGVRKNERR